MERLQEGWVRFARYPCKKGCIDRWIGDCINDPNNPNVHGLQLNMTTAFYRLNGGKWISKDNFTSSFFPELLILKEDFDADEIWHFYLIFREQDQ